MATQKMTIGEIRRVIESARWTRNDLGGATREEFRRMRVDLSMEAHIAALLALQIPAGFTADIARRDEEIERCSATLGALARSEHRRGTGGSMSTTTPIPATATPREAAAIALADYHAHLRLQLRGHFEDCTSFEVSGCRTIGKDHGDTDIVERCDDSLAEFWSVYGRLPNGIAIWLVDCDERIDAQDYHTALTEHGDRTAQASVSPPLPQLSEGGANPGGVNSPRGLPSRGGAMNVAQDADDLLQRAFVASLTSVPQYVCSGCDRQMDSVSISDDKNTDESGNVVRLFRPSCPFCGEPVRRNVGWRRS